MSSELLPSTFLFHFAVPCRYRRTIWGATGIKLEETHRVPSFGELDGQKSFADVRTAWNGTGLTFTVQVVGKKASVWCRGTRLEESDGLHLWIDTRDTRNIHRASRYCHRFAFLPAGDGPQYQSPVAGWLPINRAKENPKPVSSNVLQVRGSVQASGYQLQAHVPASALTGFDPQEHPRMGFYFAVVDRELGWQTLNMGSEFPFAEDPSLWGSLVLETHDNKLS
jgi:hypothetical protein